MYIVDLECSNNHSFEGWYVDRAEYDKIIADGDLTCPLCETHDVKRVLTTGQPKTSKTRDMQDRHNEIPPHEFVGRSFYGKALAMAEGRETPAPIAGIITNDEAEKLDAAGVHTRRVRIGGVMSEEEGEHIYDRTTRGPDPEDIH